MRKTTKRSLAWKVLATAAGAGLFAAFVAAGAASLPPRAGEPKLLCGPYAINLAADGVTICWQTESPSAGAVRYKPAEAAAWSRAAASGAGAFHLARLSPLQAGGEYAAEVLAGERKLGEISFRTIPAKAEEFTFYAYGDTRSNPRDHKQVVAGLLAEANRLGQFTFLLHTGDLALQGSDERSTAQQFFQVAQPLLERLPILAVRGNHEGGTDLFRRYFPSPGAPQDRAEGDNACLDYGSVRLIVLDDYAPEISRPAQRKWLADKLAAAQDRWRLVTFHEPIYSSGEHGSAMRFRDLFEPTLVAGRVHAVLAGHDHDYERTKPVQGITHFVTGGGGAPLRGLHADAAQWTWSEKFEMTLNFLTIDVRPDKLTVRAFRPAARGEAFDVFDTVEIPRDCGWPGQPAGTQPASRPAR